MGDVFLKGSASARGLVQHKPQGQPLQWDPQQATARLLAPIVEPVKALLVQLHNAQTTMRQQQEVIDELQRQVARLKDGHGT